MIRKITETIKGPIISWENYLTDSELLGLKLNLRTVEGIINTLLEQDRLDPGNKTFEDLIEELTAWWKQHNNEINVNEKISRVDKYYWELYDHVKYSMERARNDNVRLADGYWDDYESLNTYKKLRKYVL